jgi:hypothetical protein
MAGPDFNIIKPELAGSFGAGYRASQENRMATEENQIKLDQLKADRQAMIQLQEQLKANGHDPDLNKVFDAFIATGKPDYVMKGLDGKKRLQAQSEFAKMMNLDMPGAAPAAPMAAPGAPMAAPAPTNALAGAPAAPMAAPTAPVNAMAGNQPMVAQTQTRINNLLNYAARNAGTPEGNQAIQQAKIMQDQLEMYNRQKSPSLADRYVPVGKHVFDRETQKWISAPGGGGGGGDGAGPAPKPMTAVQNQKFKKEMAADVVGVQSAKSTADELEKLTDELVGNPDKKIAPHKGLGGITGYSSFVFNAPKSEARDAQQKLDTFKGKIRTFGRQLASQEGKLGNMAVQEWKMVADSIQAIDPAAKNFDEQMRDVVRQARIAADRIKDRYDMTYEGQDGAAPATPAAPKAESVSIGGKTYARPAGMSNADWAEYKASQGVKQ